MGLSPRRRGNQIRNLVAPGLIGPIPAQAGEPMRSTRPPTPTRAYPRAGGGTGIEKGIEAFNAGLSPRRRGNQLAAQQLPVRHGPIPAQAGEPPRAAPSAPCSRAYPRAGGGTCDTWDEAPHDTGLSPRRRGNPHGGLRPDRPLGPIPAQAGEPSAAPSSRRSPRAYPRAGGGTPPSPGLPCHTPGLSPRRRGNPGLAMRRKTRTGPIPAQAGEPCGHCSFLGQSRAYPRAGGGTVPQGREHLAPAGLSPRRRGNRQCHGVRVQPAGPIPAQAGEPDTDCPRQRIRRAYPRAGGGTRGPGFAQQPALGLSPRRRGNLGQADGARPVRGPIPAQAGEPMRSTRPPTPTRAYPRAGGGTGIEKGIEAFNAGLSPRRRGNPGGGQRHRARHGPIPAQAGEPSCRACPAGSTRAYPRAGGGTSPVKWASVWCPGLSPRRRGNPRFRAPLAIYAGPIPAQAGEPEQGGGAGREIGAYPRAGGGTDEDREEAEFYPGLSPRRRGNRAGNRCGVVGVGPIPAQAGEPGARAGRSSG